MTTIVDAEPGSPSSDTGRCTLGDMPRQRPKDPIAAAVEELRTIPERIDEHRDAQADLAARRLELIHVLLDAGWSQAQIARELGVTPVAINKLLIRERQQRGE